MKFKIDKIKKLYETFSLIVGFSSVAIFLNLKSVFLVLKSK